MLSNRARLVTGIAVLCGLTAAALAVPPTLWKFKNWVAYGEGADPLTGNPNVDGIAIMKINSDNSTNISLVLHGLRPNEMYSVQVARDGMPIHNNVEAFTTNSKGKGMYDWTGDFGANTGEPVVYIYQWNGRCDPLLPGVPDDIIDPDEERAMAIPS
jgi:hypothetical protein